MPNTTIPDQDNQSRSSEADGERFTLQPGDQTTVDGAPVLTIDDDEVRFTNFGTASTTGDTSTVRVTGEDASIANTASGTITAEQTGVEVTDGGSADIRNDGTIAGGFNGVNFANGTDNSGGSLLNTGTISSDSRGVNFGGDGVEVVNRGTIVGTGDQRNGTVYADGTADNFSVSNEDEGVIDAGEGNAGAGVSLQIGDRDGDDVVGSFVNHGTVQGRGEATEGPLVGDGLRLFSSNEFVEIQGDITNHGTIRASSDSTESAAISVEENVRVRGEIQNFGRLEAEDIALDASEARIRVIVRNEGEIDGRVVLSEGNDRFFGGASNFDTVVEGGLGDDRIITGSGDDDITGGLGSDRILGGSGRDTVFYNDVDVAVQVDLEAETATRETGFSVSFDDQPLASLTTAQSPADLVDEAVAGNLYFNIHTNDFNAGEIRGQLLVESDVVDGGVRTITLQASLDAAQEPGPTSDSAATGEGTVTITVDGDDITYSADLSVTGLAVSDLLPVAGVSSIHLHNAPAGVNGPVITDIIQDAGGDVNGNALAADADTGDGDVFVEVAETDEVRQIDNVVGSNDGDVIRGDDDRNQLDGLDGNDELDGGRGDDTLNGGTGDDVLRGGGGVDFIDGGEGIDTNSFSNINGAGTNPEELGVTVNLAADGTGTAEYFAGQVSNANLVSEFFTGIENIDGSVNNDTIIATGAAANVINGGAGDDFIAGGGGIDILDGGDGSDTNSFQGIGAEVVADLATGSASYQPNPVVTVFENFSNFENLDGSANDDQLFGDGGANVLTGNDGDDLLVGRGGADTLEGGSGDDVLRGGGGSDVTDGGEGIDTADFSDIGVSVDVSLDRGDGVYQVNGNQIVDTLIDIENLTGSANDDELEGDGGDNLLAGGAGGDELRGGDGNDILRGDSVGDGEAITVTVTNTLGAGGTFLTPVWFGFHDGANFDLFDAGSAASLGLERLAEDGSIEGLAAEFSQQTGVNGVDATIIGGIGAPGPIDPGESASFTLNVNPDDVGQGFFTWATMIIPSNDAFLAVPDDALADPIFDADGNFLGPITIQRFGSDVLDAGTEVNDEEGAAFLNQTARDQGTVEGGVVAAHPGFNGSEGNPDATPVNVLGGTTAAGTIVDPVEGDFSRNGGAEQLLEITIDRAPGGNDDLFGGAGDDILDGGRGDDTLEGGTGIDTFIFEGESGIDTVTDFGADANFLDLSSDELNFASLADVQSAASQVGDDVVLDLGAGNQVTLLDLTVDQLTDDNVLL